RSGEKHRCGIYDRVSLEIDPTRLLIWTTTSGRALRATGRVLRTSSTSGTFRTGRESRDSGKPAHARPAAAPATIQPPAHPPLGSGGIVPRGGCETAPAPSRPDAAACTACPSPAASIPHRNSRTSPTPARRENFPPDTARKFPEISPPKWPGKFYPSLRPREPSASAPLQRTEIPSTNGGSPRLKPGSPSR